MARFDVVMQGSSFRTNLVSLGLCTVALVREDENTLLDTGHFGNRRQILRALSNLGLAPSDIDSVILTHSHWDHVLNLEIFSRASVVINSMELNHVRSIVGYDWATPSYLSKILEKREVKVTVGDQAISKDMRVIETPGHSPGHQAVLVRTERGNVLFSGDAMPTLRSYQLGLPDYITVNEEEAGRSVAKLRDLKPDSIYPGHDRPFKLVDGKLEYIEHSELKVIFRGEKENFGMVLGTEEAENPERM